MYKLSVEEWAIAPVGQQAPELCIGNGQQQPTHWSLALQI